MWLQAGWTLCLLVAHPALVAGAGVFDDGPNGIPTRSNLDFLDRLPSPHIVLLNTEPLASAASPVAPAFAAAHPRRSASAARAASAADAGGAADAGSAAASGDASRQVAAYRQQLLDQQAAVLRTLGVQPPLSNGAASAASAADGGVGGYSYAPPGGGGGGPRVTQQYTAVVNGFSVSGLSDAQAAALRALPGVASVTRAGWAVPLTVSTPAFLGLSGPGKAWERHFGGPRGAGADVLVGVIDSGGWGLGVGLFVGGAEDVTVRRGGAAPRSRGRADAVRAPGRARRRGRAAGARQRPGRGSGARALIFTATAAPNPQHTPAPERMACALPPPLPHLPPLPASPLPSSPPRHLHGFALIRGRVPVQRQRGRHQPPRARGVLRGGRLHGRQAGRLQVRAQRRAVRNGALCGRRVLPCSPF